MLPDKTTLQLFEAMEDQQITTAETASMMTTVFNSAISGMVMVFGMVMFNRVLKHNPGNPGNPSNPVGWEDKGFLELSSFLREGESPFGPTCISEFFNTGKLVPAVELALKRYIVGYFLIASNKHDAAVVDGTYRAIKTIWHNFKSWFGTSKLEEEAGETAEVIREELEATVEEVDKSILLVDSGGSKVLFIDNFASQEHINLNVVVRGFIGMFQSAPEDLDSALMNYYYALAEMKP